MKQLSEYIEIYENVPVAVLGGGPSLSRDVKRLPENTVCISVNHHALYGHRCEYMVFMDDPLNNSALYLALARYKGIKISQQREYTDISIYDYPDIGFSSPLAVWFAEITGSTKIILCGMDCYRGAKLYYHSSSSAKNPAMLAPLSNHIEAWQRYRPKNRDNIYVASGPLIGVFQEY